VRASLYLVQGTNLPSTLILYDLSCSVSVSSGALPVILPLLDATNMLRNTPSSGLPPCTMLCSCRRKNAGLAKAAGVVLDVVGCCVRDLFASAVQQEHLFISMLISVSYGLILYGDGRCSTTTGRSGFLFCWRRHRARVSGAGTRFVW